MMKTAVALILATLIAGTVMAQPNLEIVGNRFDFGKVPRNSTLVRHFWFKSTGSETVRIDSLNTGCSCATMPLPKNELAPGDSMLVGFYWDVKNSIGNAGKYPYIYTNAPNSPSRVQLTALAMSKAELMTPIAVMPYKFELVQVGAKSIDSIAFEVTNNSDEEISLVSISAPLNQCEVNFPLKIAAKTTMSGYIKVRQAFLNTEFKETLSFQLSDNTNSHISIPIRRYFYGKKDK